jgi:hypothetical protein
MNDGDNNLYFYLDSSNSYGSVSTYNYATSSTLPFLINANGGNVSAGPVPNLTPSNTMTVSGRASIGAGYFNNAAPTNGLIVQGYVGIGTTSPTQPLEIVTSGNNGMRVVGSTSNQFATFEAVNDANHYFFATVSGTAFSAAYLDANQALLYTDAPGGLRLTTESTVPMRFDTNSTERMRIDGNGKLGIGTTSPGQLLDVANKFQVDSNGNILKINNIATSFPSSQGAVNAVLTNDGSGNLTWASPSGTPLTSVVTITAAQLKTPNIVVTLLPALPSGQSYVIHMVEYYMPFNSVAYVNPGAGYGIYYDSVPDPSGTIFQTPSNTGTGFFTSTSSIYGVAQTATSSVTVPSNKSVVFADDSGGTPLTTGDSPLNIRITYQIVSPASF